MNLYRKSKWGKIYGTTESRYVSLDEIEKVIIEGGEVFILDSETSADCTYKTLLEIILRREREHLGQDGTRAEIFHEIIKSGKSFSEFFRDLKGIPQYQD